MAFVAEKLFNTVSNVVAQGVSQLPVSYERVQEMKNATRTAAKEATKGVVDVVLEGLPRVVPMILLGGIGIWLFFVLIPSLAIALRKCRSMSSAAEVAVDPPVFRREAFEESQEGLGLTQQVWEALDNTRDK